MQQKYRTLVFDCDGVVLDSNNVRTEGFRQIAQPYGEEVVESLVAFHLQNGGVSRYAKFAYLLTEILREPLLAETVNKLAQRYSECVYGNLLDCPVTEGLRELRQATMENRWMIVSGADQNELRRLFAERNLDTLFDGGIFGSPANKDEILAREVNSGNLQQPALFIGDSRYDHESATRAGFDFVFASDWTDFSGWEDYASGNQLSVVAQVKDLIPRLSRQMMD
jgi:phosphoglycolate phosphatase-like HAD superfamily hydrolase